MVDKFLLVGLKADLPAVRDANKLYWCSDTRELYKGMDLYTEAVRIVSAMPATPAQGVLYVLPTGEVKVFNGTDTVTVAKQYVDSTAGVLTAANTDDQVATAKAVYDSITSAIGTVKDSIVKGGALVNNIISTKAGTITVTKGEYTQVATDAVYSASVNYFEKVNDAYVLATVTAETFADKIATGLYVSSDETDVAVKGVVVNPTYDASTRTITLPYADGTESLVISLGKDIFLDPTAQNKYNPDTGNIELFLNDVNGGTPTMISIPASDLVDVYTGETSADGSATVNVSTDNKITASVNVSADAGNKLVKKSDGLYVDAVDQADFDTLDTQVNGTQTQVALKQDGAATDASYTYSADDKFLVDGVETVIASKDDLDAKIADTAVNSVVAIVGKDGIAKRLTTAESDIEQIQKDITGLADVHVDAAADNKYDDTTGKIYLYLNDGDADKNVQPTKIEVTVAELKAAVAAIDTINTTLKDGIYVELAHTDKFDVNTTYFVLSDGEFVADSTVSADNFNDKIVNGLYVIASDAIELLAAKVDANAQNIAANTEAIGELSYVKCTSNSVYVAGVTYYAKDPSGNYIADAAVTDDATLQNAVTVGNSYVKTNDAVRVNESRIAAIETALSWGTF